MLLLRDSKDIFLSSAILLSSFLASFVSCGDMVSISWISFSYLGFQYGQTAVNRQIRQKVQSYHVQEQIHSWAKLKAQACFHRHCFIVGFQHDQHNKRMENGHRSNKERTFNIQQPFFQLFSRRLVFLQHFSRAFSILKFPDFPSPISLPSRIRWHLKIASLSFCICPIFNRVCFNTPSRVKYDFN